MENTNLQIFNALVQTVARLRAPDGCPWDRAQTHSSIASNMTEEAAEAVDAIERGDLVDLREELGDVLLQVLLQSQMASEAGEFELADVIDGINNKLIRRHPHVFGNAAAFASANLSVEQLQLIEAAQDPDAVLNLWDNIKLIEHQQKAAAKAAVRATGAVATDADIAAAGVGSLFEIAALTDEGSLLDSVPTALPALMQAQDISRKAVSAGFEWESLAAVWDQVEAELAEYQEARQKVADARQDARSGAAATAATAAAAVAAEEEFGDVLFSLCNVARKEGIDAESALRRSCRKFRGRWAMMERYARAQGMRLEELPTAELEELWQRAKREITAAEAIG